MRSYELGYEINGEATLGSAVQDGQVNLDEGGYMESSAVDTNSDGIYDAFSMVVDSNTDGVPDTVILENDYNQDGLIDTQKVYMDQNGDGRFDQVVEAYDSNQDGFLDHYETMVDTNGDGLPDITVEEEFLESENGSPDLYVVSTDLDGDGSTDLVEMYGYDPETGTLFPLDEAMHVGISAQVELEQFDPSQADPEDICGDPAADMENWECQGQTNRCTLYAQKFVIEELTGQEVDIETVADIAEENGWFSEENGGNALDMANVLEYYGLEPEMSYHNDMEDIQLCLEEGGKVIVSVDSGEIWFGETDELFCPVDGADHAVQVIGIDYSDPDNPMVILNDSGSPEGCGEMVPMDVFVDAWEDGDCQMITCYA